MSEQGRKQVAWIGDSLKQLKKMPLSVRQVFGQAIFAAELNKKHPSARPLKGYGGAGVLEVVEDYNTDTYRAVYTVRFPEMVCVLHVFQKKSKEGIKTPKSEMDTIEARLKAATVLYGQKGKK